MIIGMVAPLRVRNRWGRFWMWFWRHMPLRLDLAHRALMGYPILYRCTINSQEAAVLVGANGGIAENFVDGAGPAVIGVYGRADKRWSDLR